MPKILFILKRREDFDPVKHNPKGLSTGLFNSATFMVDMLNSAGVEAVLEVAIDNNCIDRLVTQHKPTHVIIEALWVVPTKFAVLCPLHPKVKWIIRLHSEMPFMAGEGIAMDWLGDYVTFPNLQIGVNAPRMLDEVRTYLRIKQGWDTAETERRVFYMPNFYPQEYKAKTYAPQGDIIHVGCFGAVRLLKNHLMQAFAALKFADSIGKKLHFHINVGRLEMKGEPVLHNLIGLFSQLSKQGHQLIMHEWTPREGFLELCAQMDIGLQVSFSETFNIVGADLISQGVPLVGSVEIPWLSDVWAARAEHCDEIYTALKTVHEQGGTANVITNQLLLTNYTNKTRDHWVNNLFKD